jgi:hypothetical protein
MRHNGMALIGMGLFGMVCHSGPQNLPDFQNSRSQSSAVAAFSPSRVGSSPRGERLGHSQIGKAAPSAQALTQYAVQILTEAEQVAQREPDPEYRAWACERIAYTWLKRNPERAKPMLERAWQVSKKIEDETCRSQHQREIILYWAQIDEATARKLTPQIRNTECREAVEQQLAQYVTLGDFARGVQLLNAIPNRKDRQQEVLGAVDHFMEMDGAPDRAIRLIFAVKGVDTDPLVQSVIVHAVKTNPDKAQALLARLRSSAMREQTWLYLVSQMASTQPQKAARMAEQIRQPRQRAVALAEIAEKWVMKDREQARELAAEAFFAAGKVTARDERFILAREMVPSLAAIETAQSRGFLERLMPEIPQTSKRMRASHLLMMASVWASVETVRAEALYREAVQLDNSICVDFHGEFEGSFVALIFRLALQEPERAARLFQEQAKNVRRPDVRSFIEGLKESNPAMALRFAEAGRSPKTRDALRDAWQQEGFAQQARANPTRAAVFLSKIKDAFARDSVTCDVAISLARTDLAGARRLAKSIQDSSRRSYVLCDMGKRLVQKRHPAAMDVLREAAAAARQQKSAFHSATDLIGVAEAAYTPAYVW